MFLHSLYDETIWAGGLLLFLELVLYLVCPGWGISLITDWQIFLICLLWQLKQLKACQVTEKRSSVKLRIFNWYKSWTQTTPLFKKINKPIRSENSTVLYLYKKQSCISIECDLCAHTRFVQLFWNFKYEVGMSLSQNEMYCSVFYNLSFPWTSAHFRRIDFASSCSPETI